jgi:hypothetical protein
MPGARSARSPTHRWIPACPLGAARRRDRSSTETAVSRWCRPPRAEGPRVEARSAGRASHLGALGAHQVGSPGRHRRRERCRSRCNAFALDALVRPLSLRTNCRDDARISSSVAGSWEVGIPSSMNTDQKRAWFFGMSLDRAARKKGRGSEHPRPIATHVVLVPRLRACRARAQWAGRTGHNERAGPGGSGTLSYAREDSLFAAIAPHARDRVKLPEDVMETAKWAWRLDKSIRLHGGGWLLQAVHRGAGRKGVESPPRPLVAHGEGVNGPFIARCGG